MKVAVRTLRAKTLLIDAETDSDVATLKAAVASKLGLAGDVKLVWKGKSLNDEAKLADLGLLAPSVDRCKRKYAARSLFWRIENHPERQRLQQQNVSEVFDVAAEENNNIDMVSVDRPAASLKERNSFDDNKQPMSSKVPEGPKSNVDSPAAKFVDEKMEENGELAQMMGLIALELRDPHFGESSNSYSAQVLRPITKMVESPSAMNYFNQPAVHTWISKGLRSRNAALSGGVSRLLSRSVINNDEKLSKILFESKEVLKAILVAICDSDIEISAPAGTLLSEIAQRREGVLKAFCDDKAVFEAVKEDSFVETRFRIFETAAKISQVAKEGPADFISSAIFRMVVKIAKRGPSDSDPLLWPNALEIVGETMQTVSGFEAVLYSEKLFDIILADARRRDLLNTRDKLMVLHHLALATRRSRQFSWILALDSVSNTQVTDSRLLDAVLIICEEGLRSIDDTTKAMAEHGTCLLAACLKDLRQQQTKILMDLEVTESKLKSPSPYFQRLHKNLMTVADVAGENTSGPVRVAALVGLAHVFGNGQEKLISDSKESRESLDFFTWDHTKVDSRMLIMDPFEEVWEGLAKRVNMEAISKSIESPYEDITGAAYMYLRNAATHLWGLEHISLTPGLMETLLDRESGAGSSPRAHEWRFATLQAIAMTLKRNTLDERRMERLIDKSMRERLVQFIRDGPYSKEPRAPQVKVATATRKE